MVVRLSIVVLLIAVCFFAACNSNTLETRSHAKIYILRHDVKAGEQFTKDLVDEIDFSDETGYYDMRKDFDLVTRATLSDYLGQYFTKDLEQFTPVGSAELTERDPDRP